MGAVDYLMTQTRNVDYMARFEPAQLEYFYGFPVWVESCWAIAVWGGVLGCVFLLMRRSWAVPVFLASLIAMVATAGYNFGFSNGMDVMGATGMGFTVAIFFIALGLWLYARAMRRLGVLI